MEKFFEFIIANVKSTLIALVIIVLIGSLFFPNMVEMLKELNKEREYTHKVLLESLEKKVKIIEEEKRNIIHKYNMAAQKNNAISKENISLKSKIKKLEGRLHTYDKLFNMLDGLISIDLFSQIRLHNMEGSYNLMINLPCVEHATTIDTFKLLLNNIFSKDLAVINEASALMEQEELPPDLADFFWQYSDLT